MKLLLAGLVVVALMAPTLALAKGPVVSDGTTYRGPIVSGPKK